jgi:hypothetical protein
MYSGNLLQSLNYTFGMTRCRQRFVQRCSLHIRSTRTVGVVRILSLSLLYFLMPLFCRGSSAVVLSDITVASIVQHGVIVVLPAEVSTITLYNGADDEHLRTKEMQELASATPKAIPQSVISGADLPLLPYFDFNHTLTGESRWALIRLKITIVTEVACSIALLTVARSQYCCRCNGAFVGPFQSTKWLEKYGHVSRLDMHPGSNDIIIVIAACKGQASLSLGLSTVDQGLSIADDNWLDTGLTRYVYAPCEGLAFNSHWALGPISSNTSICEMAGCPTLPEGNPTTVPSVVGVASVAIIGAQETCREERFAVIVPAICHARLNALSNTNVLIPREKADLSVLSERVAWLLSPEHRRVDNNMGERDLVELWGEFERLERINFSQHHKDWLDTAGRHFGSYLSSRDKVQMPYMMFIPNRTTFTPALLPLVVIFPSSSASRPQFFNSYTIDFTDVIHSFVSAADLNGCILLWPYGRNLEHSTDTESDVWECIDAVCSRFPVNRKYICVIGSCGSGRDALVFGARHRDLVFAVAAQELPLQQLTESKANRSGDLSEISVLDYVKTLAKMNVFISHGQLDRHVPVEDSLQFVAALRGAGGNPETHIIPGADEAYFPERNNQWIAEALSYFRNQAIVDGQNIPRF